MALPVSMGTMCKCSFGTVTSGLAFSPTRFVMAEGKPMACILDNKFATFGMCNSTTNPAVVAATAAASGVFTSAPCVPVTVAPWLPGSLTVLIKGSPALNNSSKLMCSWGGVISVATPSVVRVQIKK